MKEGFSLRDGIQFFENPTNKSDGDTAQCCRVFSLPIGPEELLDEYEKFLSEGKSKWGEIEKIIGMAIYLGKFDTTPEGEKLETAGYYYTCVHLNRETGECNDYENRPQMCSGYPYGAPESQCALCLTKEICNAFKGDSNVKAS